MNVALWPTAWDDDRHWQDHDATMLDKLRTLIEECGRHPCKGTIAAISAAALACVLPLAIAA